MKLLEPIDDSTIHRHSSIDQYKDHFLCVIRGGRAIPISFDIIDYIKCCNGRKRTVVSHQAILGWGTDLGYHFPVAAKKYFSDLYVLSDHYGTETVKGDPFFGAETYERFFNERVFVNSDTNSLGVRNLGQLKIGLDYVIADKTIPAVTDD